MLAIQSPAKINWFLYVLGKRQDGYHEILSPMQKISLFDSLSFSDAEETCILGAPEIPDNIILKAVHALKNYKPVQKNVGITLRKEIPLAAGLGGGSSNAAAALEGLNKFWDLNLSREELGLLGAGIGSDVPFFTGGNVSLVKGKGEILVPCEITQSYPLLLVNPGIRISSRWAYENNSSFIAVKGDEAEGFIDALNAGDFGRMEHFMANSLEGPVFSKYTVIKEIKDELKRRGASVSLMSGSGSTVFGVFEDDEKASGAQKYFQEFWTRVVKTLP